MRFSQMIKIIKTQNENKGKDPLNVLFQPS